MITSRLLTDDQRQILADVKRQLAVYEADMRRDFAYRRADIEKLLVEMERRGHDYFDETLRLTRVTHLLDKARIRARIDALA